MSSRKPEPLLIIPEKWAATIEEAAKQRAAELKLDWASLSEAHQHGIRKTVWEEFNWRD